MKKRIPLLVISCLSAANIGSTAEETVLIGSSGSLPWQEGGGTIAATAILDESTVNQTNTPGGVIDFESIDFPGWIFPQRVDTTDNILIGLTSKERGGSISSPIPSAQVSFKNDYKKLIDADGQTALEVRATSSASSAGALGLILEFDLNALFAVNRIRFFPRNAAPELPAPDFPFQNDFIKGYEIFINDGRPESYLNNRPIWTTIALEGQNEEAVVDLSIPTQFVRQIRFKSLTTADFEIAEFQVFAEGFVPQATYLSNVFDFGEPALLGYLRWIQETIGDSVLSDIQIRTRTGMDPEPVEFTRVGIQSIGLTEVSRTVGGVSNLEEIRVKVPWKRQQDVEDDELRTLVETELEDDLLSGEEALLAWTRLPLKLRAQLEISQAEYGKLKEKGPIRDDLTNWSPWSPPYSAAGIVEAQALETPRAGTPILSPSPRRYFQFMVEFASRGFDAASGLGALGFELSTPALADTLIGEVFPRHADVGAATVFSYAVLTKIGQTTAGFDQLEIETPLKVESIGMVEVHKPNGEIESADFSSRSLDDLPVEAGGFAVLAVSDHGLLLQLPPVNENNALVKVEFATAVLRFGTVFSARAFNTEVGAVGQNILAGNAADLGRETLVDPDLARIGAPVPTNLTVEVAISDDLLTNVRAEPVVFTPNGDQINDHTSIHYDITNIASPVLVEIELFNLAGRSIKSLQMEKQTSGRFAIVWEGTDDEGRLVTPGHYIYTVTLNADTGADKRLGAVGVVY